MEEKENGFGGVNCIPQPHLENLVSPAVTVDPRYLMEKGYYRKMEEMSPDFLAPKTGVRELQYLISLGR